MLFFIKAIAWIPAVEPDSCSHIEIRVKNGSTVQFKKRFALQSEGGFWGEWLVPLKVTKGTIKKHGTTDYIVHGSTLEIAMVSTNGKEGPPSSTPIYMSNVPVGPPVVFYNEPVSAPATKRKKPVVDAHWNATFVSLVQVGLGKEIQAPG